MALTAFLGFVQYSSIDSPSRQPAKEPAMGYAGTRSANPPLYAATTRSRGVTVVVVGSIVILLAAASGLQHRTKSVQRKVDLLGAEVGAEEHHAEVGPGGEPARHPLAGLAGRAIDDELLQQLLALRRYRSRELRGVRGENRLHRFPEAVPHQGLAVER